MAGGVTLNVRQIGSYPLLGSVAGYSDALVLVQPGGIGSPYATVSTFTLVQTALEAGGPLGVGYTPPPGATSNGIFTGEINLPIAGGLIWGGSGTSNTMGGAGFVYEQPTGFRWAINGTNPMVLNNAGALELTFGTLTVARDPGSALEVATMGYVGKHTVNSFNGRQGAVTLNGCDIYSALCLNEPIATQPWVMAAIQNSTEMLLANHPFVFGWNGRTGAVWLTLADISCVFFQPGQQPITQTPPPTSNDYSIPNTAWVVNFINNELEGAGGIIATQSWVLANTVNSFNGRQGPVTLTTADVIDVGAAPINSPNFSGIPSAPTAAVGQATGQIATTAFVQMAIAANTAGVSTWNTRSGAVVLEAADVTGVGGLVNPSPNLLGNPTAPTQPPGTNLPVIATCEFVQTALNGAVRSFNTRTGAVVLTLADVTGVGGAPLVSPNFSSVPTAPTAAPGTNTVQLATTAFVTAALTAAGGVSSFNGRTGAVDLIPNDISAAGGLVNPSVNLTGQPTATTATAGDNSQRIATTAFVATALTAGAVSSFNTRTGAVVLTAADITAAGGALLAGPAFTGVPTAPTAATATNNTQIATTAFVNAAIAANTATVTSFNTRTGAVVLTTADIIGAGGAPIASPSFTGTPLGPTATAGTSTTQLATTQFVQTAIASSGVSSFNSRTGAVTLIANDISAAGGALLNSPVFTGTPTVPGYLPLTSGTLSNTLSFSGGNGIAYSGVGHTIAFGWSGTYVTASVDGTGTPGALMNVSGGTFSGDVGIQGPNGLTLTHNINAAGSIVAGNNNVTLASTGITINSGPLDLPQSGAVRIHDAGNTPQIIVSLNSNTVVFGNGSISPSSTYIYGGANVELYPASNSAGSFVVRNGVACYNQAGGPWSSLSDIRLKDKIADYSTGLEAVLALRPVTYVFNGRGGLVADGKTYVGLIADEVESVMPEMVGRTRGKLDENDAEETDILSLDTGPLIYALINCVKTMLGRIEALESAAGIA